MIARERQVLELLGTAGNIGRVGPFAWALCFQAPQCTGFYLMHVAKCMSYAHGPEPLDSRHR